MSNLEDFLSSEEEQEIVQAITQAERNTSGEIRVHIESTTKLRHYDRALEVFQKLEMNKTEQQNGVLIYIAVEDHKFVIYGDKGIDAVVPDNFWDSTKIYNYFYNFTVFECINSFKNNFQSFTSTVNPIEVKFMCTSVIYQLFVMT